MRSTFCRLLTALAGGALATVVLIATPVAAQVDSVPVRPEPATYETDVEVLGPIDGCGPGAPDQGIFFDVQPGEQGPTVFVRGLVTGRLFFDEAGGLTFEGSETIRRITTPDGEEREEAEQDFWDPTFDGTNLSGPWRHVEDGTCTAGADIRVPMGPWADTLSGYDGLGPAPVSLSELNVYSDGDRLLAEGGVLGANPGFSLAISYDQSGVESVFGDGTTTVGDDGLFMFDVPLEAEGFCVVRVSSGIYFLGADSFDCMLGEAVGGPIDLTPTIVVQVPVEKEGPEPETEPEQATVEESAVDGPVSTQESEERTIDEGSQEEAASVPATDGGGGSSTVPIVGGALGGVLLLGGRAYALNRRRQSSTTRDTVPASTATQAPVPAVTSDDDPSLMDALLLLGREPTETSTDFETEWRAVVNREDTIQAQLAEDWQQTGADVVDALNQYFASIDRFREPWTKAWSGTTGMQGLLTEGEQAIDTAEWADLVWGLAQLGKGAAVGGYKAAMFLAHPKRLPWMGRKLMNRLGYVPDVDLNVYRRKYFSLLDANTDKAMTRLADEAGVDLAEFMSHFDNADDAGTALMLAVAKKRGWVLIDDGAATVLGRLAHMADDMYSGTLNATDRAQFATDLAKLDDWSQRPGFWDKLADAAGWVEESARFGDTYDQIEVLELLFSPSAIRWLLRLADDTSLPRTVTRLDDVTDTIRIGSRGADAADGIRTLSPDDLQRTLRPGDLTPTVDAEDLTRTQIIHIDDVTRTQLLEGGSPVATLGPVGDTVIMGGVTPPTVVWQPATDLAGDIAGATLRVDAPTVHLPVGGLGVDDATVILQTPGAWASVPFSAGPQLGDALFDATVVLPGTAETELGIGELMRRLMDTPLDDPALAETRLDIGELMKRLMDTPLDTPAGEAAQQLGSARLVVRAGADDASALADTVVGIDDATVLLPAAGDALAETTRILGDLQPPAVLIAPGASHPPSGVLADDAATVLVDATPTVALGQWRGSQCVLDTVRAPAGLDLSSIPRLDPPANGLSMSDAVITGTGIDVNMWLTRCGDEATSYDDLVDTCSQRLGWHPVPIDIAMAGDDVLRTGREAVATGSGEIPESALATLSRGNEIPGFWSWLSTGTALLSDGVGYVFNGPDLDIMHSAVLSHGDVRAITEATGPMRTNALGAVIDAGPAPRLTDEIFLDPDDLPTLGADAFGPPAFDAPTQLDRDRFVLQAQQQFEFAGFLGSIGIDNFVRQFGDPQEADKQFNFAFWSWEGSGEDGGMEFIGALAASPLLAGFWLASDPDLAVTFGSRLGRVLSAPIQTQTEYFYTQRAWEELQEFFEANPDTFHDMTIAYNDAIRALERLGSALDSLDDPSTPLGGAAAAGLQEVLDGYEALVDSADADDRAAMQGEHGDRVQHIEQKLADLEQARQGLVLLEGHGEQYQTWLRGLATDHEGRPGAPHKLMDPEAVVRLLGGALGMRELTADAFLLRDPPDRSAATTRAPADDDTPVGDPTQIQLQLAELDAAFDDASPPDLSEFDSSGDG